jgi:hypothetical protein
MKAVIDGQFLLSAMRKRVDVIGQLHEKGFSVSIPRESLQKMKSYQFKDSSSSVDRAIVQRVLEMAENGSIEKESVGQGKITDWLITKGNEGVYIGSGSNKVLRNVKNVIGIDSNGKIVL